MTQLYLGSNLRTLRGGLPEPLEPTTRHPDSHRSLGSLLLDRSPCLPVFFFLTSFFFLPFHRLGTLIYVWCPSPLVPSFLSGPKNSGYKQPGRRRRATRSKRQLAPEPPRHTGQASEERAIGNSATISEKQTTRETLQK